MKVDFIFNALKMKIKQLHPASVLSILIICIFVGTSAFFALKLKRDIVPDEGVHIALSQHFATSFGIPPDVPETYQYGSIPHKPNLYYWLSGRMLNILSRLIHDPGSWKTLVSLRLLNVLYATLAVIFFYLLAKEIIQNRWWQLLALFLLTNTLMFVFLAGGVNYDNLANLCSFAGIYFLIRLLNGKSFFRNSLGWMICILAGTLAKITVLPLLAVMSFIWVIYIIRQWNQVNFKPLTEWKTGVLLVIFLGLLMANFSIYGLNLLRYHSLLPSCTMVLTKSQCGQNPVFARAETISSSDGFSVADLFNGNVPDPFVWFNEYWIRNMLKMIYGAVGFSSYKPSDLMITVILLWFLWALAIAIRFWKKPSLAVVGLSVIVFFYTLVLLRTNISSELETGFRHLGIQGRYYFPVIGGLYILVVYSFARIPGKIVSSATALVTLILFFYNSPLWILTHPAALQLPSTAIPAEMADIPIGNGNEASQDFTSECLGTITRIEVMASSSQESANYSVQFRLTDLQNNMLIVDQTLKDETIGEQTWLAFPIPPLRGTKDHRYRITLTASGDDQNRTIALWNTSRNIYRGGDAIVQGVPTNQDIIFNYTCRVPLLASWFN